MKTVVQVFNRPRQQIEPRPTSWQYPLINYPATNEELGLIGLHTCGDLAANSLQIFLANDCIKFCCNVGCCYHLLNEEFYTKVLHKNEGNGCATDQTPCFPMSKLLRRQKFSLGKNARMVAAQPMDRAINNKQVIWHLFLFLTASLILVVLVSHKLCQT